MNIHQMIDLILKISGWRVIQALLAVSGLVQGIVAIWGWTYVSTPENDLLFATIACFVMCLGFVAIAYSEPSDPRR